MNNKKNVAVSETEEVPNRTGIAVLDFALNIMEDVRRSDPDWVEGGEFGYEIVSLKAKKKKKKKKGKKK